MSSTSLPLAGRITDLVSVVLIAGLLTAGCGVEPSAAPADPSPEAAPADPAPATSAPEPGDRVAVAPGSDALQTLPPLHAAIDGLDETVVTLTTPTGDVEVLAKVASAAEDRTRGLMEVTDLPDGAGMLFLFDEDRTGGFWMWNTVIPLDIAFAAADGVVHTTATMTPCEAERSTQCPITAPSEPYRAALEVPAGWLERSGVLAGATMTWTTPAPDVG
jgi:uncharacterized protein